VDLSRRCVVLNGSSHAKRPRIPRLPSVYIDEDGAALPGYEQHNASAYELAYTRGVAVKEYVGMGMDDDDDDEESRE
jgi:hypothetical protein